jgi:hypothetical protein
VGPLLPSSSRSNVPFFITQWGTTVVMARRRSIVHPMWMMRWGHVFTPRGTLRNLISPHTWGSVVPMMTTWLQGSCPWRRVMTSHRTWWHIVPTIIFCSQGPYPRSRVMTSPWTWWYIVTTMIMWSRGPCPLKIVVTFPQTWWFVVTMMITWSRDLVLDEE